MDLKRFEACCAAFGALRRRWPAHEHTLFDHFQCTAQGAAMLAEAERTDRLLDTFASAPPDAHLLRRIAALSRPAWRRYVAPAAAFATCGVLGFALGFVQAQRALDTRAVADLLLGTPNPQELGL